VREAVRPSTNSSATDRTRCNKTLLTPASLYKAVK